MSDTEENSSFESDGKSASQQRKGRRGPAAGKWQNGKGCFSAWYSAKFLISLRRLAKNLGLDPSELVQSRLEPITDTVRLTEEDQEELRTAMASVRGKTA